MPLYIISSTPEHKAAVDAWISAVNADPTLYIPEWATYSKPEQNPTDSSLWRTNITMWSPAGLYPLDAVVPTFDLNLQLLASDDPSWVFAPPPPPPPG